MAPAAPTTERWRGRLRKVGLRATRPRLAVLEHLQRAERPCSHADVVDALGDDGWDRATLFRNLNDLATAGLLRRIDVDHTWRFELVQDEDGHPHFVCVSCGDIQCLGGVELQADASGDGSTASLLARAQEVQIRGVCEECS